MEHMLNEDEMSVIRSFLKGIEAININLVDCAKSLRKIASGTESDDKWHSVDENGNPGPEYEEYDWVLVKIADDPDLLPVKNERIHDLPHIAEFRDGRWFPEEWNEPYGSLTVPFKVVSWRPIPGDSCEVLYCDGKPMKRVHRYE